MKRQRVIWLLFFAVMLASCANPDKEAITMPQSLKLFAIDTLMQSRPDSALKALYSCKDTSYVSASDRHYYQLLLSEALYKNDSAQQNRPELLKAMAYFDSIDNAFLSARCHYMNGVGYYEMDSVVAACAEYLKALEIMESHFEERDLMEYKAKFMALAYTHLCVLFSDQYLHEQAIYFGKCALCFYNKYDAEPWHITWILDMIGSHYDMMEKWDSAEYYYQQAYNVLPDTISITYRDLKTHQLLLSYKKSSQETQSIINQLKNLLEFAEYDNELFSRCLTIGEIYYCERQYDSAWPYLHKVYENKKNLTIKKQAAEWLAEICKIKGRQTEITEYSIFLISFANVNENQSNIKSQLTKLFQDYEQENKEALHQKRIFKIKEQVLVILAILVLLSLALIVSISIGRKKQTHLKKQREKAENELRTKEIQHSAALGKMKKTVKQLREENKKLNEKQIQTNKNTDVSTPKKEMYRVFLFEKICLNIQQKIKKTDKYTSYNVKDYDKAGLSQKEISEFIQVIDKHCPDFSKRLKKRYPDLNSNDIQLCRFYLLNLTILQVSILLNTDYSSIRKRTNHLKEKIGSEELHLQLKSMFFEVD